MKILCLYATHQHSYNLDFFLKHGIYSSPEIDYWVILNDPQMKLEVPEGVKILRRENKNADFGAWSQALLTDDLYLQYDYFILLNSTVRGPFFPVWQKNRNWPKIFVDNLTEDLKLFGTSIGWYRYPHVQSMFLVMDKISMKIAIEKGIFALESIARPYMDLVEQKEVALSQHILNTGYNIGCMLKALEGVDFRKHQGDRFNVFFWRGHYYGVDVHPYETIFIKTKNYVGICESSPYVSRISMFEEGSHPRLYEPFDWISYLIRDEELWRSGIRTKEAVTNYYHHNRGLTGRIIHAEPTMGAFYCIDLGCSEQINCLANAILIGHFTGRAISISEEVIDIDYLNVLIVRLGLFTQVGTNGHRYQTKDSIGKDLKLQGNYLEVLHTLRQETEPGLNLGKTLNFFPDPELKRLHDQLVTGFYFTRSKTFTVFSWKVAHGTLGLGGKFGYHNTQERIELEEGVESLSAHAPSQIILSVKQKIELQGYCSPTAQKPSPIRFFCSDRLIGETTRGGEKTEIIILDPGIYILRTEVSNIAWGHAIWLLSTA